MLTTTQVEVRKSSPINYTKKDGTVVDFVELNCEFADGEPVKLRSDVPFERGTLLDVELEIVAISTPRYYGTLEYRLVNVSVAE